MVGVGTRRWIAPRVTGAFAGRAPRSDLRPRATWATRCPGPCTPGQASAGKICKSKNPKKRLDGTPLAAGAQLDRHFRSHIFSFSYRRLSGQGTVPIQNSVSRAGDKSEQLTHLGWSRWWAAADLYGSITASLPHKALPACHTEQKALPAFHRKHCQPAMQSGKHCRPAIQSAAMERTAG